jgi:hypothetical protein
MYSRLYRFGPALSPSVSPLALARVDRVDVVWQLKTSTLRSRFHDLLLLSIPLHNVHTWRSWHPIQLAQPTSNKTACEGYVCRDTETPSQEHLPLSVVPALLPAIDLLGTKPVSLAYASANIIIVQFSLVQEYYYTLWLFAALSIPPSLYSVNKQLDLAGVREPSSLFHTRISLGRMLPRIPWISGGIDFSWRNVYDRRPLPRLSLPTQLTVHVQASSQLPIPILFSSGNCFRAIQ